MAIAKGTGGGGIRPKIVTVPAPRLGAGAPKPPAKPAPPATSLRAINVMPTTPTSIGVAGAGAYNRPGAYIPRSTQLTPKDLGITKPFTRPPVTGGRGYYIPYTYQGVPGSYDTLTGDFIVNGIQVGNLANSGGGGGGGTGGGGGGGGGGGREYVSPFSMGLVNWRV